MVCKNCGKTIPDGVSNCPECGAAQNAAPAQNAAQNLGNAVNSGISSIDKNLPTVNIAGRTVKLSVMSLAPALMILFLIIGMIGVFSFNTIKIKSKISAYGYSATDTERSSLSDVDSDSIDAMDAGLTKVIKVVNVIAIIASIGALGLCGYMTYKNDTVKATLAVGLSGAILALAYFLDIINAFYLKGKTKDMFKDTGAKISGGATFGAFFWFIIMAAIAFGAYTISNKVKASQSAKV
jgi:TRAP-type C4-dicarboxylate transport system permease small subunit